jgi:hypothetical protein
LKMGQRHSLCNIKVLAEHMAVTPRWKFQAIPAKKPSPQKSEGKPLSFWLLSLSTKLV